MMKYLNNNLNIKAVSVLCVLLFYMFPSFADELEERRIKISLAIFPKIVAVDQDLVSKLTRENEVKFLFVYDDNRSRAEALSELLRDKVTNIAGKPVRIVVMSVRDVSLIFTERSAAIFITERLDKTQFNKIVRVGVSEQILVFSPYAGDVERGATVGIAIGNRVRPYFNIDTLNTSKVNILKKLLKVSKRYE